MNETSENFRFIDRELAGDIGLNEAIILQRIHELISEKQLFRDGRYWIRRSYPEWLEEFPFMTNAPLRNRIKRLEGMNILYAANYNEDNRDHTKWYTINYSAPELAEWKKRWVKE